MSKKRREKKSYNPMKAKRAGFERQLKKVWLARTWNDPELLRGGIDYNAPDCGLFCDHLLERPHVWTVLLASFQRDENGGIWTHFEEHPIKEPVLARHISGYLTEELQALHNERNAKYAVGTGWYAVPTLCDLLAETDGIEEMFRYAGAFVPKTTGQVAA